MVEAFCRILISRLPWPDFERGIEVFEEKNDLLPFEEAKLYGHNAAHALLGYLARLRDCSFMDEIRDHPDLLALGREAFLAESGAALCLKHKGVDTLFTERGFRAYAEDLLERMLNPNLRDAIERVVRDPRRKFGWHDRLVGTMRLAVAQGITPNRFALGAAAAFSMLLETAQETQILCPFALWSESNPDPDEAEVMTELIAKAQGQLDIVATSIPDFSS